MEGGATMGAMAGTGVRWAPTVASPGTRGGMDAGVRLEKESPAMESRSSSRADRL